MTVAHKRTSSAHSSDMVARWRLRCETLEEQLEDPTVSSPQTIGTPLTDCGSRTRD